MLKQFWDIARKKNQYRDSVNKIGVNDQGKNLRDAIVAGITKYYDDNLHRWEIIAASLLHPGFKNNWTNDDNLICIAMLAIRDLLKLPDYSLTPPTNYDDDESFYVMQQAPEKVDALDIYLKAPSSS
ncbi:hypothetical protein Ciccas_006920 [Cichlidogyrus casuarinus]|uniref:Uncharacterized protein n=1 Tax=Cichlidogyrus casuarinus TaxID=1844966 RepID=A0ABD2Q4D7_9PLAT